MHSAKSVTSKCQPLTILQTAALVAATCSLQSRQRSGSSGDLWVPSPAPGAGMGAGVHTWQRHFPELRVTPALAASSSLSEDTSTPHPVGRCSQFHRGPWFAEEGRSHQADTKQGQNRSLWGATSWPGAKPAVASDEALSKDGTKIPARLACHVRATSLREVCGLGKGCR